ncbi:MAG: hypothetical protein RhofKO_40010 [Rhodothermales bacterium]
MLGGSTAYADDRAPTVPGVIVVRWDDTASKRADVAVQVLEAKFGGIEWENVLPVRGANKRMSVLRQVQYVRYSSPHAPGFVAAKFAELAGVVYAEPLYLHAPTAMPQAVPDDPRYSQMSHLVQVSAPEAWDIVKGEEGEVIIGIVDSGTEWRHEDLQANAWLNVDEIDGNGLDDDNNGFIDDARGWSFARDNGDPSPLPGDQHGTVVAGVAAAVSDNGIGVAGMSWNARFLAVNAACSNGNRLICSGYPGIVYAASNGATVINASFSRDGGGSRFEQDVIDFAYEQGALVVAAASNDNDDNDVTARFPAGYDRVLSVGATNKNNDVRANFSNYGRTVDVFAPGASLNSTTINGAYNDFANGTSFSAPMVSGLVALIQTQHPDWSVDRVREQVRVTADPIDSSNPSFVGRLGQGRINALRALTESGSPAIRPIGATFEEVSGDGDEGIEDGETYRVTVRLTNYLADANSVTVRLTAADNVLTVLNTTATLGGLASGDTATVAFSFRVDDAPDDFDARFITDITSGSYTDTELFAVTINPADFEPLDTGAIRTAILANGNFGWGHFAGSSPGEGFVVNGSNLLFEGGLMVGIGPSRVSNNIRTGTDAVADADFEAGAGQQIIVSEPGGTTFQEGSVIIEDNLAENPIGIEVEHIIFADTSTVNRDFVILRYTITNETTAPVSNIHAGVFADWDLSSDAADDASYDATRQMGMAQDEITTPTTVVGMRLLTDAAPPAFEAVSNPGMIYDDFTDAEKWQVLSGGIGTQTQTGIDLSLLIGAGPFSLDPGCSVDMAVAVVGGDQVEGVKAASDQAQRLWDEQIEVLQTNTAPRFTTAVPDTSIMPGVRIAIPLQATDVDDCDALTFSLESGPVDASVDPQTGLFTYDPETASNLGSFPVEVAVTDGRRRATLAFTINVLVNASAEDERPVAEFVLDAPFPNPASEAVTLNFAVPVVTTLDLRVFDVLGRTVRVLAQGAVAPGRHTLTWAGRDAEGATVANGLYVVRLVATAADGRQQVREQTVVWAR